MGIFRQAVIDTAALELYTGRLIHFNVQDVLAALKVIEDLPREEGRTAFPEIGAVLEEVRRQVNLRLAHADAARNKIMTIWQCPDCRVTMTGFLERGASMERRCESRMIPFSQRNKGDAFGHGLPMGQICGAAMRVVHQDEEKSGPTWRA
jgi:hypothetical protein